MTVHTRAACTSRINADRLRLYFENSGWIGPVVTAEKRLAA
ncbi:hypothetical protein [Celeribacter baekdonensis]|nr:hypothetical protein [Celeribacter baekdonensis]